MTAVFTLISARPHTNPSDTGLRHASATSPLGRPTPTNIQIATPIIQEKSRCRESLTEPPETRTAFGDIYQCAGGS